MVIIITEIESNNIRTFEVVNGNIKYFLDVTLNDTNEIIEVYLKNPIMHNLADLNVLKKIIIKLEEYNWVN